jgi:hypothetical protein
MKMPRPQATTSETNEFDEKSFVKDDLSLKEDKGCAHHFVRVSPTRVECKACKIGYIDDPSSEFPIDQLNEYYQQEQNRTFYKNI